MRAAGQSSDCTTSGSPNAYPTRSPANDQVLVRLRSTSTSGSAAPANDSGSPGIESMKASSTTSSRPGRTQPENRLTRVQHPGGVGRIAHHQQICFFGHHGLGQPVRGIEYHLRRRDPGGVEDRLRLGERRRDESNRSRLQLRQQGKTFRPAGQQQHFIGATPMTPGRRGARGCDIGGRRVVAQVIQTGGQAARSASPAAAHYGR